MSSLTATEKRVLEQVLGMGGGYVLGFSDRTFSEFILDTMAVEIYTERYAEFGTSKAKRLRAFWKVEPDHVVARLLAALLDYSAEEGSGGQHPELLPKARQIVERLRQSAPVQDLDAITPNAEGRDFEALAKSVHDAIQRNKPEEGLDRLHTFVVKYLRVLCEKEGIATPPDKPVHSLLGELLKALKQRGLVESAMSERILKSTISILDAFNDVRNNRSLAHDNKMLSYPEALLIFNNVASAVRFLGSLVAPAPTSAENSGLEVDDIPF
jgi:hypothetical protein